jgi:hypothetical protein
MSHYARIALANSENFFYEVVFLCKSCFIEAHYRFQARGFLHTGEEIWNQLP